MLKLLDGEKSELTYLDQLIKYIDAKKRWGAYFISVRESTGLTPNQIDEIMEFTPGTYETFEVGFRLPDMKTFKKLWATLGPSAQWKFQITFNEIKEDAHLYNEREITLPIG